MATREEIKEKILIMQAWLDGEEIEVRGSWDGESPWEGCTYDPAWDFSSCEYRIKPKEVWGRMYSDGSGCMYDSRQAALDSEGSDGIVKFREVLDGE